MNEELIIHLRQFKDGFPICWTAEEFGEFTGSYNEEDVTCTSCLTHLEETYAVSL